MGLLPPAIKMLVGARNFLQKTCPERRPWKMLSLSWQDIITSNPQIIGMLGNEFLDVPDHPDQESILRWHKVVGEGKRIPDWVEILKRLGFDPVVTDLGNFRGCEEFLDLNEPLDDKYRDRFDMVLDNCSQHCANIGQAMKNVFDALKVGGLAMHVTPLQMINQGFYSVCPGMYHDFYSQNGFTVLEHSGYYGGKQGKPTVPIAIDPVRRMQLNHSDAMQLFIAVKNKAQQMKWPIQTKFINAPDSTTRDGSQ